jgi:sugar/nucleoside kinase (ribokinase family)
MRNVLLTVGNIYIDHNIFGIKSDQEKFTLESGKDYGGSRSERVLGGSAVNAAMQAGRLGIQVGFIGKTGSDEGGRQVRALLEEEGILSELVCEDQNLATSMAVNLVSTNGEFVGVHYGEASKNLTADDIDLSHDIFSHTAAVYFGGTAKQPFLLKDGERLFQQLRSRDIKIFYDPNRFPVQEEATDRSLLLAQLAYVEGYFPNQMELLQLTDKTAIDDALDVALNTGVAFIALKLGAKGCRVITQNEDFTINGHKIIPVTTVGAGDCFNATFMASYLVGQPLRECAERATAAAAIKVSQNVWPNQSAITGLLSAAS